MDDRFVEAVEKAISNLVTDFQDEPGSFRNERQMHWALFHHLKREEFFRHKYFGTELIQAEFPANYGGKWWGYYDLVIVGKFQKPESAGVPWETWDMYLPRVEVMVAIEVKIWVDRADFHNEVDKDIKKLTESKKPVKHPYFLNFVRLNFNRNDMQDHYQALRKYLIDQDRRWPKLRILCVPSDSKIQPEPKQNWLTED